MKKWTAKRVMLSIRDAIDVILSQIALEAVTQSNIVLFQRYRFSIAYYMMRKETIASYSTIK